jgi:hypothetical protein
MHDAAGEMVEHGARALDVGGLPAEQREQLALAHGRDRSHHRRIDQACALGLDHRRQVTMGHRLQRAHLDEKFALDLA